MAHAQAGLDRDQFGSILDRLVSLGVTVREKRSRLIVRGQPGYERDTAVQSLVARLRGDHAAFPEEVEEIVRQREKC